MTSFFKLFFICFIVLWLASGCQHHNDFCQPVKDFEKQNEAKRGNALYLYPGTIKMFNYNRDSSFDAFVKDIQKLKILTFTSDKGMIGDDKINSLIGNINKASFAELLRMKRNDQLYSIFMRKEGQKPKEFVAIVRSDSSLVVADLLGSIPVGQLPSLLSGNTNFSGFSAFLNNSMKKKNQSNKKKKPAENEKRPSDQ